MGIDFQDIPDLSFGLQRYTAVKINLEGIIEKISTLFNVGDYVKALNDIDRRATNEISNSPIMPFEGMQLYSEGVMYDKYIIEIEALKNEIEKKYLIYYKIFLLTDNLKNTLNQEIKLSNIGGFIDDAKELIKKINEIVSNNLWGEVTNSAKADSIVHDAYEAIYRVLKYEELFDRHDIFEYIYEKGLKVNRETISRLITKDIKDNNINLDELLRRIELDNIDNEGLGFDHFRLDIIKEISRLTVGKVNKEYQKRRQDAIESLVQKADFISQENDRLTNRKAENNAIIRRKQFASLLVVGWLALSSSLPISLGFVGYKWGKNKSDKIDLYQTTTCTRDLATGNIIGDKEVIFDDVKTTYVATIKECGPWRTNPNGKGFIRDIIAYEYIAPEDAKVGHKVTEYEIREDYIRKHFYAETKDSLDDGDSKTDTVILITETYQDKSVTTKSKKYIFPLTLLGLSLGTVAVIGLNNYTKFGFNGTTRKLNELSTLINNYKLDNRQIDEQLQGLVQISNELMHQKDEIEHNFGSIKDKFIITDYQDKINLDGLGLHDINNNTIDPPKLKQHIKRTR